MFLLIGSFFAGMLTVLAPCVLALLPVIIGGSVSGDVKDKKRPVIIAASLAVSLFTFTILLKVTSLLIDIPPNSISYISGGIIVGLGSLMLFPSVYAKLIARLGIEQRAQSTLSKGFKNKKQYTGPIVIGAALGPVFSSCSPVYAYILATVLPVNFGVALAYIVSYILGLTLVLLLIGYFGQGFVSKIKFASDPKGWFQRTVAILFIITGLLIFTGYDKRLQTWVSQNTPFDFDSLSSQLLPDNERLNSEEIFNVEPYPMPEFVGLNNWINSDPITKADLEGRVVVIDFWTYSCINCIRNNPYLIEWYDKYEQFGLEIIAVHAPEFAFEKVTANVEKAVRDQNIDYPVALDNDFATWNNFDNRAWPSAYFVDAKGQIRRLHEGEGDYKQSEYAIRQLLIEAGKDVSRIPFDGDFSGPPITAKQTAETYMGLTRFSNFEGSSALGAAKVQSFTAVDDLEEDFWTLGGRWESGNTKITARGNNSSLKFHVAAKEVYVVMGSEDEQDVEVLLDGKPISLTEFAGTDVKDGKVPVSEFKLYRLVDFEEFSSGIIELKVPNGVEINAFTFGS